jgi:hypothetical protein
MFSIGIKLLVSSRYCFIVAHILHVLTDCVFETTITFITFLSLNANTTFDGLNVVANRLIKTGEELTLDYSTLLDENAQSFECQCKSVNCKGIIEGIKGNSITYREKKQHQNQGKS